MRRLDGALGLRPRQRTFESSPALQRWDRRKKLFLTRDLDGRAKFSQTEITTGIVSTATEDPSIASKSSSNAIEGSSIGTECLSMATEDLSIAKEGSSIATEGSSITTEVG